MTHQELKAVGDAWAAALAGDIVIVVAQIDARCEVRRAKEKDFDAATVFCGIPSNTVLGDQGARQRLIATGILT